MRERRPAQERRHAREFERFVAGRLLPTATLLTGEPASRPAPAAEELVIRRRRARRLGLLRTLLSPTPPARALTARPWHPPAHTTPRTEGW
ncbi:hypothetical protein ACIPXV_05545 [Streptomyces libani]|uniref:hypothetical protein n=1 Tax=Streptomyces TaxID=1883 RepID=UPI0037DA1FEB